MINQVPEQMRLHLDNIARNGKVLCGCPSVLNTFLAKDRLLSSRCASEWQRGLNTPSLLTPEFGAYPHPRDSQSLNQIDTVRFNQDKKTWLTLSDRIGWGKDTFTHLVRQYTIITIRIDKRLAYHAAPNGDGHESKPMVGPMSKTSMYTHVNIDNHYFYSGMNNGIQSYLSDR